MAQDWGMQHGKLSNVYCNTFYNKPLCHSLLFQIQWPTGFELTIHDLGAKFKVSRRNIFQETKKLQTVIISRAQIYTKLPQIALNFT